jgi:phosphotransferase system  glucose/maltose/N-acetylglucosamine-specific IIC component
MNRKIMLVPTFYMLLASLAAGYLWGPAFGVLTWVGLWWSGMLTGRFS